MQAMLVLACWAAAGAEGPTDRLGFQADDFGNGAMVRSVAPNSPAAAINLRSGDLIVAVNGQMVSADATVAKLLPAKGDGELLLTVRRGAQDFTVPLKAAGNISRKPVQDNGLIPTPAGDGGVPGFGANMPLPAKLGIGLQSIDPQLRMDLGLKENEGARVVSMAAESVAAVGGIRMSDILVSVNGKPVMDQASTSQALEGLKPNVDFKAEVLRGGRLVPITLRLRRESFPPDPVPAAGPGGAAASAALMARLEEMERRIQRLESEVADLKRGQPMGAVPRIGGDQSERKRIESPGKGAAKGPSDDLAFPPAPPPTGK